MTFEEFIQQNYGVKIGPENDPREWSISRRAWNAAQEAMRERAAVAAESTTGGESYDPWNAACQVLAETIRKMPVE